MTSYLSLAFLGVFLPVCMLLYQITPKSKRWITLLISNTAFFMMICHPVTIIYLIVSIFIMYGIGLKMDQLKKARKAAVKQAEKPEKKAIRKAYEKRSRHWVTLGVLLEVGLLLVLKYTGFMLENVNGVLGLFGVAVPIPTIWLPIGISFYTMQAMSYLFDVYRETIPADRNFGRLALYMSFFPSLMEGPICRYTDTAQNLWQGERITYSNMTHGIQRILYGLFKKMIIADRLNVMIKTIYSTYAELDGTIMMIGAVFYTIQLYMEFSGTMEVVLGVGEIYGVKLPENFRQPLFSRSISDFWARWHITLGTWFRDYIFYPVSMSGPLKKWTLSSRKKLGNYYGPVLVSGIALFCVWFSNGVWHGDAWNFIFYGMFHFTLILSGRLMEPTFVKATEKLHIDREKTWFKGVQLVRTLILIFIGELFFRASGLKAGLVMFFKMLTQFRPATLWDGTLLTMGMDGMDYLILAFALIVVLVISILKERHMYLRTWLDRKPLAIRWLVLYGLIICVILFGAYGMGYTPIDPIYAGF